jgi:predicted MFS family arabinose efflux permease
MTAVSPPIPLSRSSSSAWLVAACTLLGLAGYGFYSGLPVILGALADTRHIPSASLGWIASAEILGLLLGGLAGTFFTDKFGRRSLGLWGVLLVAVSHVASMSPSVGFGGLVVARLVGGLGGGAIYAVGVSSLALTPDPAKSVATFSAVLAAIATLEVGVLPVVMGHFGVSGLFYVLIAMAALGMLGIRALPRRDAGAAVVSSTNASRIDGASWLILAGMACFHVAPVIYWTYGERIGVGGGIPETTLGIVFTASGILGALACFGTGSMARKLGQVHSLQLCTVVMGIGLLSWLVGSLTPATYLLRACLVGIPWVLGGVFQVNVANEIDPTGRLSALVGPAQNVGLMVGPAIASTLLAAGQGFSIVLGVATIFLVISFYLARAGRRRPAAAST